MRRCGEEGEGVAGVTIIIRNISFCANNVMHSWRRASRTTGFCTHRNQRWRGKTTRTMGRPQLKTSWCRQGFDLNSTFFQEAVSCILCFLRLEVSFPNLLGDLAGPVTCPTSLGPVPGPTTLGPVTCTTARGAAGGGSCASAGGGGGRLPALLPAPAEPAVALRLRCLQPRAL